MREGTGHPGKTLIVRENNLVAAECALGRACMECDIGHD
jgi:hypothetical protein